MNRLGHNITPFLRWNVPITLIERKDKRKLKYIKEKEREARAPENDSYRITQKRDHPCSRVMA